MIVDSFAKNIDTLNRLNVARLTFALYIIGLIKQLKIFPQSVAKKQDVFGNFTDWPRQEFDLPDAKNFKCSTVIVIVMPLMLK